MELQEQKEQTIEIIQELKNGSHLAFEKLFTLYSNPVYRFSFSYLKSQEIAEDVVQEVFVKIWENRCKIKTNTSFQSYIFTIALNIIRRQFNKASKLNEAKYEILLESHSSNSEVEEFPRYEELLCKLENLIDGMPEKRKEVFVKKKIEGKSSKEIAQELKISIKTVEYHITSAMKLLKSEFKSSENLHLILLTFCFLKKISGKQTRVF